MELLVDLPLFTHRKADIVAHLLETERSNVKRKQVEVEEKEMGKLKKSRSKGGITLKIK